MTLSPVVEKPEGAVSPEVEAGATPEEEAVVAVFRAVAPLQAAAFHPVRDDPAR